MKNNPKQLGFLEKYLIKMIIGILILILTVAWAIML